MDLQELRKKTVLLFGKSRAFSSDEFEIQMDSHEIFISKEFNDDVAFVVEGRMMTPYEQNSSENIYEHKDVEFISIDELERELARHIDEDMLLMSLKLSHDKKRLKSFIQNSMISDTLFFKLLEMYSWNGDDFFETDENRDITSALISRFYKDIERNHNIQYSTLGITHLVAQTRDEALLEVVASLEPLQHSFNIKNKKDAKYSVLTTIATHDFTPRKVLRMFIKKGDSYIKTLIAMRSHCEYSMQKILFEDGDKDALEALSYNFNLDKNIAKKMFKHEEYAKNIARHIKIDAEIFYALLDKYAVELAQNESLNYELQKQLISLHKNDVKLSLAANTQIEEQFINELVSEGSDDISLVIYENANTPKTTLEEAYADVANHFALAHNKNTPVKILKLLAQSSNPKVLEGLAKNESTPIEILYQLQLDRRFERFVKENPTFGKHIQNENLGWL